MIPIRQYWSLLRIYLRRQRALVSALSVLLFAGIGLQVANPQIIKVFIDRAVAGAELDALVPIAVLFLAAAVVRQILIVGATWMAEHIGWRATNDLRRDLAEHLIRLDMGFHKGHSPGEMVERVDGDVTALSNFFGQFTIQVVGNALLVAGVLALLARENLLIGLAMTVMAVATFGVMTRIQGLASEWWRAVRGHRARFFGFVGEVAAATEDVRANGATGYVTDRAAGMMREWLPDEVRGRHGFSILWGSNIVYFAAANATLFALGSWLFNDGVISLGSAYLVFHYTDMLRHPLDRIRTQFEDMQKAGAGIVRVRELLAQRTALPDAGEGRLPRGPLAVSFDAVGFAYRDDAEGNGERVLHGVTFRLEAGRILGVLGRTGSGKTTIARLLTRLYDADEGRVTLAGSPVPDVVLADLRRRVGMVTQDVQLFRGTIRDNLTFFDPGVGEERLMDALDQLGLGEWVRAKPDGLDTVLAGAGADLSAGEAQLLAFARVFLEDSGLVVLDEASSRVDPATERLIERALDRLLGDRTAVIIAHRLDTVQRADDILILDDGSVVEHGPRRELAADPESRFSSLLRTGIEEVLA